MRIAPIVGRVVGVVGLAAAFGCAQDGERAAASAVVRDSANITIV